MLLASSLASNHGSYADILREGDHVEDGCGREWWVGGRWKRRGRHKATLSRLDEQRVQHFTRDSLSDTHTRASFCKRSVSKAFSDSNSLRGEVKWKKRLATRTLVEADHDPITTTQKRWRTLGMLNSKDAANGHIR